MVKNGLFKGKFTVGLVFFLSLLMLFLYTTTEITNPQIRDSSLWNLVLLGTLGSLIVASTTENLGLWFTVNNPKQLINQAVVGTVLGLIVAYVVVGVIYGFQYLFSLISVIPVSVLSSMSFSEAFFTVVIQPVTESILLVSSLLFFRNVFLGFFKSKLIAVVLAILLVSVMFSGLHFTARQKQATSMGVEFPYENTFNGFLEFVFDWSNFGSSDYYGAFPQLVLGVFWSLIILLYESAVLGMFSHIASNWLVLYFANVSGDASIVVSVVGVVLVVLTLFVLWKQQLKPFEDYSVKRVVS